MSRELGRTSKKALAFFALSNMAGYLFASYYILYLQQNGLDYVQMAIIFSMSYLTVLLFDFPTGNFADKHGRMRSLALGSAIGGIAVIIYGLTSNFWIFIGCELMAGLGMALKSGSGSAWIVDALKGEGRESEVKPFFSITYGISSVVGVLAGGIAFVLASYSLNLPFLMSGVVGVVAAIVGVLFFKDNFGTRKKTKQIMKDSLSHFLTEPGLRWLATGEVLRACSILTYLFLYQPYLVGNGLEVAYLGIFFSMLALVSAGGSFMSDRVSIKLGTVRGMMVYSSMLIIAFAALPFTKDAVMIGVLFLVCEFSQGLANPTATVWTNELIPSGIRASVLSLISTLTNGACIGVTLLLGYLMSNEENGTVFLFAAAMAFLSIICYHMVSRARPGKDSGMPASV